MLINFNDESAKYTQLFKDFFSANQSEIGEVLQRWDLQLGLKDIDGRDTTAGSELAVMLLSRYHNWEIYTTNKDAFMFSLEGIFMRWWRYYDEKLRVYLKPFDWIKNKYETIENSSSKETTNDETETISGETSNSKSGSNNIDKTENKNVSETNELEQTTTDDPHLVTETHYDLPRSTVSENRPSTIDETEHDEHINEVEGKNTRGMIDATDGSIDSEYSEESSASNDSSRYKSLTKNEKEGEVISSEGNEDILKARQEMLNQVRDYFYEFAGKFQPLFLEVWL